MTHNPIQAEYSVIGSICISPDIFERIISTKLESWHFTDHILGKLYQVMCDMFTQDVPSDLVTVYSWLESHSYDIDTPKAIETLQAAVDATPAACNAPHYAKIIVDTYCENEFKRGMGEVSAMIANGEPVADIRMHLAGILEQSMVSESDDCGSILDLLNGGVGLKKASSIPYEWEQMNRRTGGLPEGALSVIGAYPGVGKTAFTTQTLTHFAREQRPVAFYSCEMSSAQVMQTLIARESGVSAGVLRKYGLDDLSPHLMPLVRKALENIMKLPFYIESGSLSAFEIAASAKKYQKKHGVNTIAVDYLQLLKPSSAEKDRRLSIDKSVQILKVLGVKNGFSVILLSQMARGNGNREPSMELLKESGGIGEAADYALLLDRPKFQAEEDCVCGTGCKTCKFTGKVSADNEMMIKVGKNKMGESGAKVKLHWHGSRMMISDWRD